MSFFCCFGKEKTPGSPTSQHVHTPLLDKKKAETSKDNLCDRIFKSLGTHGFSISFQSGERTVLEGPRFNFSGETLSLVNQGSLRLRSTVKTVADHQFTGTFDFIHQLSDREVPRFLIRGTLTLHTQHGSRIQDFTIFTLTDIPQDATLNNIPAWIFEIHEGSTHSPTNRTIIGDISANRVILRSLKLTEVSLD